MPALPLFDIAKQACIRSIKSITDVGDIPYNIIRPALLRVENPYQLMELEKASPQLLGEDEELWRAFIKRDIPNWEKKPHVPQNPHNWSKVYKKLKKEAEAEINKDTEILKSKLNARATDRAKHTTTLKSFDELPKLPKTTRTSYGRQTTTPRGPAAKSILAKARQNVRDRPRLHPQKPTLPLRRFNSASRIQKAPQGMVQEYKTAQPQLQEIQSIRVRAPKTSPIYATATGLSGREQRLLAIKELGSQTTSKLPPVIGDDEFDSDPEPASSSKSIHRVPKRSPQPLSQIKRLAPTKRKPVDVFMPPTKKRKV
ncbi:MAG: hypothetical protein M1834_007299 [Cirrosporium novae-zelandiae]|nr:MAG: hypothetical protein M1834_007299 [Cirrosporium novae-zelandiae]